MAQPAPAAQQSPAQVQARVAAVLAGTFATAAALAAALFAALAGLGLSLLAVRAVAAVLARYPAPVMEGTGPATRLVVRQNMLRRAAWAQAAALRVQAALDRARADGAPAGEALSRAVADEATWFRQHCDASAGRVQAASAVDGMAAVHGLLLGWRAVLDGKTSPECRAANGKNFRADAPPAIGYPGSVHRGCRCRPSPPLPGAPVMRPAPLPA